MEVICPFQWKTNASSHRVRMEAPALPRSVYLRIFPYGDISEQQLHLSMWFRLRWHELWKWVSYEKNTRSWRNMWTLERMNAFQFISRVPLLRANTEHARTVEHQDSTLARALQDGREETVMRVRMIHPLMSNISSSSDINECTVAAAKTPVQTLCFNTGTCVNNPGSYSCDCVNGTYGADCSISECEKLI